MPYKPKDGRPAAPDAPPLDIFPTDREMLTGTAVRPAKMNPTIGPTWRSQFSGKQMSETVPGAEMIPMELPALAALWSLRGNEQAVEKQRAKHRQRNRWENERIEKEPKFTPFAMRGLKGAQERDPW